MKSGLSVTHCRWIPELNKASWQLKYFKSINVKVSFFVSHVILSRQVGSISELCFVF